MISLNGYPCNYRGALRQLAVFHLNQMIELVIYALKRARSLN